jgi:hypothetical protein
MESQYDERLGARSRRDVWEGRSSMAAPWMLIGSIVLIVGAFLDWASGTGGTTVLGGTAGTTDVSGYNLIDGRIAGALGVALLVSALLMWTNKRVESWFDSDLLGVALSATAITLVVMFLLDVGNEALSADYGAYVSLAGGAIAFIGALIALLGSRSDRMAVDRDDRDDVARRRVA